MRMFWVVLLALPLVAQTAPPPDPHRNDFDYLLGDWEFTAKNQQYGTMRGLWSAAQLGEGGPIVDEYRIVGDNGETYYVTRTVRAYNAKAKEWELVSTEGSSGLQNSGTGHMESGEMHIEQKFGVGTNTPSILRIRYYNIQPDHFSWTADRSTDGGRTWTKDFQQIEAKRVGASHPIVLTNPKK